MTDTWTTTRRYYDVNLGDDGQSVRTVDGASVTASLEQLTTVCEFALLDRPAVTPASGVPCAVKLVEIADTEYRHLFAGTLNIRDTEAFPHDLRLIATDPLSLLRGTADGNHLLTGMTDGEAVEFVLTELGIAFDSADIQDAGYVLGGRADVFWSGGETGAAVIAELDRVLGMKTLCIQDGRVVRFAYDLAPDAGDIQTTYAAGTDTTISRVRRTLGDRDRIQNVWNVRGVSAECLHADGVTTCSCTPYARREADHPALGAGVRVQGQSFQSDVIQDEALALAVATRLMRWHNREPDELVIETRDDPDVHPGSVVGVTDDTYGIDLSADPYCVRLVERRSGRMTLTCVGGAAGATGTGTSGVEQRCNETSVAVDWPGTFTPPTISVPPFPAPSFAWDPDFGIGSPDFNFGFDFDPNLGGIGFDLDLTTPFDFGWTLNSRHPAFPPPSSIETCEGLTGTALDDCCDEVCDGLAPNAYEACQIACQAGGGGPASCEDCEDVEGLQARAACEMEFCEDGHDAIGQLDCWEEDDPPMDTTTAGLRFGYAGTGHYPCLEIEPDRSFEVTVAFRFLVADGQLNVFLREADPAGAGWGVWADCLVFQSGVDPGDDVLWLGVGSGSVTAIEDGPPYPDNADDCLLTLAYDHEDGSMTASLDIEGVTTAVVTDDSAGDGQFDPMVVGVQALDFDGSGGSLVQIDALSLRYTD
jgi:hypothetical protein